MSNTISIGTSEIRQIDGLYSNSDNDILEDKEVQSSLASGSRTRQSCGFFVPGEDQCREGDGYKTRKGKKSTRLATGFEPPGTLIGSGQSGSMRSENLSKEFAMTQSIIVLDTSICCIDGLYSLNDLHKASGNLSKHQPAFFLRNEQTQALIAELSSADLQTLKKVVGKGKEQGTYACKELVIAYAAWISPAFHLKVIRVFLKNQKQSVPEIDVRTLLQENHYELVVSLPPELLEAIDKKAWEMAGESYLLFRDYLKRNTASYQYGEEGKEGLYVNAALESIGEATIGNALAHQFHKEIKGVKRSLEFVIYRAEKALREIQDTTSKRV